MAADSRMPALFVGHGSPMYAIEQNEYSKKWAEIAGLFAKPKAILSISAHWFTGGSHVNDEPSPKTIYDFYGFPQALYEVKYPAPGAPALAESITAMAEGRASVDNRWGIDHGTWSVLSRMYPQADIPVTQLSVDKNLSPKEALEFGRSLHTLRRQGVLIFGSGNIVHNLAHIGWQMPGGYDWADEFDDYIRRNIEKGDYDRVIDYKAAGRSASLAFTSPDHFYPLLYVLGAADERDNLTVFNDSRTLGSLSMTSYMFS